MGLLDEAIREHLELKRRRGGDPAEISMQEQEAIGPARRAPEPLEVLHEDDHDEPEHLEEAVAHEHEPYEVHEHEPLEDHEPYEAHEHEAPAVHEPEHLDAPVPDPNAEVHHGDALATEHVHEAPAPAATPEPSSSSKEPAAQETVAFDVEAALAHEEGGHKQAAASAPHAEEKPKHPDDVLEETPDFLQETPEHDRLWFEQRPPRDFDFDK